VHGGTLFLDEIDELHASLQAKLLGVLQHGEFLKMGGVQPRRVDVRILAATTRDLSGAVHGGKFARDLHQRLTTIQIRIPPLRERRKEIPRLVRYFIARYARMLNLPAPTITSSVMRRFVRHRWRGNLPELEIAAARVVLLGDVGAAVHAFPAYSRRRRTSGEG
jgi:DNA-binding NtrC family response regulator